MGARRRVRKVADPALTARLGLPAEKVKELRTSGVVA